MSESLHAALVVSLHGRAISELRAQAGPEQAAALREHIEAERTREAWLCETLRISEAQARSAQRQMWTWDGLSLALCNGWQPFTSHDVPTYEGLADIELRRAGEGTYTLDPWPFGEERVEVRCEGRRLASRYQSERAMRNAFRAAQPVTLVFAIEKR